MLVRPSFFHVFSDDLGYSIEHPLQIICLSGLLNLDDNNLSLGVLGFNVNTVVLVVARFLIRFAVKQLHDSHFLLYQY